MAGREVTALRQGVNARILESKEASDHEKAKTRKVEGEMARGKRPSIDLMALTAESAAPMNEADVS